MPQCLWLCWENLSSNIVNEQKVVFLMQTSFVLCIFNIYLKYSYFIIIELHFLAGI